MKLPITFEEFKNNPISAITFVMLMVVSYLYYDQKSTTNDIIVELRKERAEQAIKIDNLTLQLKRTDSALAVAVTELRILTKLGKF
jgi:hypothetical protein